VERECWVGETRGIERRYFINSIAADAKQFALAFYQSFFPLRLTTSTMNDCDAKSKLSAPLIYLSKTGNYSPERMAPWLRKK
jgi:hypothetical protein